MKTYKQIVNEAKDDVITLKTDFYKEKSDKKAWAKHNITPTDKNNIVKALTGKKSDLVKYFTKANGWRKEDVFDQYPELK